MAIFMKHYFNKIVFDLQMKKWLLLLSKKKTDKKCLVYKLTLNTYDTRRFKLGERPGEFKHHDYVTGKEEVGASPEDVVEEMSELLSELNDIPDDKVLTAAAYFHAKFENIHPFADGNGRAGRLLMNYILIIHNHPPIIIHQEDRREYFDALEAWDSEQELKPLIDFLTQQTEKTWQKQIHMSSCC